MADETISFLPWLLSLSLARSYVEREHPAPCYLNSTATERVCGSRIPQSTSVSATTCVHLDHILSYLDRKRVWES